jgi:hypothetical protein
MKKIGCVKVLCRRGALMRVWDWEVKGELIGEQELWRIHLSVKLSPINGWNISA